MNYLSNLYEPFPLREGAARRYREGRLISATLSVIPGLGHIIRGDVRTGMLWLIGTIVGYICFIVPGLIIHILCIYSASKLTVLAQAGLNQKRQNHHGTSPVQASLLSFFVPGLGQMTKGELASGLLWLFFTCLGYVCFIVPGIVLHILCVINAARESQAG